MVHSGHDKGGINENGLSRTSEKAARQINAWASGDEVAAILLVVKGCDDWR